MKKTEIHISFGILTTLQVMFITLKLLNLISWSWWKVFIPLYIDIGIPLAIVAVAGAVAGISHLIDFVSYMKYSFKLKRKKKQKEKEKEKLNSSVNNKKNIEDTVDKTIIETNVIQNNFEKSADEKNNSLVHCGIRKKSQDSLNYHNSKEQLQNLLDTLTTTISDNKQNDEDSKVLTRSRKRICK